MCRIFLVEDEALIRMMIASMVEELGHCVVAEAGRIEEAQPLAQSAQFDLAILDINVGGQSIFPIAQIVGQRNLPFIFSSGYGPVALPEQFYQRPTLRKPFMIQQLSAAIDAMFPRPA